MGFIDNVTSDDTTKSIDCKDGIRKQVLSDEAWDSENETSMSSIY